jgi:S-adenosylmethionine synthetase
MRSSNIKSPFHYDKICDIAVESIVELYNSTVNYYKSNLFSYIVDNQLNIVGCIESDNHYSDIEISNFIKKYIDMDIKFNIIKNKFSENTFIINSDTFLGYYCNENPEGIPFEQLEALKLSKYIYNELKIEFELELTINGKEINIFIETNYENKNKLTYIIDNYIMNSNNYLRKTITIDKFNKNKIYKSSNSFISNFYGPRASYGNTNFVGMDIYNNYRYSHLVSREIAKRILEKNKLNYCLVELTYHSNNELPIQIGIKGNEGGIYLENGTFFEYNTDFNMYRNIRDMVISKFKSTPNLLINIAKWGILYE